MAAEVVPVNVHQATLDMRTRTTKSGAVRQRTTVSVKSEPIAVLIDDQAAVAKIAETVARRITEQTKSIADTVSPATATARRAAEKAYAAGRPWALKRYGGGRTGMTPPVSGENRMFNHSGRLAESIVARWQESARAFVINYAANRWNPADFKSEAQMREAFQKWVDRVPVLRNLWADAEVREAAEETFAESFIKGEMGEDHRSVMARGRIAVRVLQLIARVVT